MAGDEQKHIKFIEFIFTVLTARAVIRAIAVIRDDDPLLPKSGATLIYMMLLTLSRVLRWLLFAA
jgi:hypothetical protein